MPSDEHGDVRPRRRRRVLVVALAGLVSSGLAGWLIWAHYSPATGRPAPRAATASPDRPLAGKVVVLDPGHNVGNRNHLAEITQKVQGSTRLTECDENGTSTNDGYPEAEFTMDVTRRVRDILRSQGATVRLTHDGNRPWGPCLDERARIGNEAHAAAAVSIHADGGPASGSGFHVILPDRLKTSRADTSGIVGPSRRLGEQVRSHFARSTDAEPADYIGDGSGLTVRKNLGGLNLSQVPKVFVECGNMRNAEDAWRMESASWRQRAAQGIAGGIAAFLTGGA